MNRVIAPMDTGVHKEGNGYERTILFAEPTEPGLVLFKVEIRVDRIPESSFARGYEWQPHLQEWTLVDQIGSAEFWYEVPGWERFASDRTERSTYRLALDVLENLRQAHRALA